MSEPIDETAPTPSETDVLMRNTLLPLRAWVRIDVLVLLLIFVVFYFYKLSGFSLSIDDELEALHTNSNVWILTGRWAGYLIDHFILPQSTIPFFPTFLFGLFLSFSYPILLSAFGIKRLGLIHYVAFPLYAAIPTWTFLAAFAANIASAGVGQLFAVCALVCFRRALDAGDGPKDTSRVGRLSLILAVGAVLLAFAIGIYQAFLFSFIALGVALILALGLQENIDWKTILRRVMLLAALTLLGVAIYAAVDVAFRTVLNLHDRAYLSNFANWHALVDSPMRTTLNVVVAMLSVYGGRSAVYGTTAFAFPLIIACGLVAIAIARKMSISQRVISLVLAGGLLSAPFLQYFLAGGNMPIRTLVAVPVVFWFFTIFGLSSRSYWLAFATFVVAVFAMLQILYSATLIDAANHFARIHDRQLAMAIYYRIADATPDFNTTKPQRVDFFGAKHFHTIYPRPSSSTAGFSFFEWGDGNDTRILGYMQLIGYSNLQPVDQGTKQRDLAVFKQMPVWPAKGSVRVVGDVTLVKLNAVLNSPL